MAQMNRFSTGMKLFVLQVILHGKNLLNIIVWLLLQQFPEKTQKPGTDLAMTDCSEIHKTRYVRMGENSGVFRPKVNHESSSSDLFSGSLII
jgi:hypothetical protein